MAKSQLRAMGPIKTEKPKRYIPQRDTQLGVSWQYYVIPLYIWLIRSTYSPRVCVVLTSKRH